MTSRFHPDRLWSGGPLLAIETSCDETSACVLVGREVRSNVISSQIALHQKYGGVVPEAAARAHVEAILPVLDEALSTAGVRLADITALAVTNRPGLVGALSVGVTAAKGLAATRELPIVGVHHLEGHILSVLIEHDVPFPHLALVVSGGHTELVLVRELGAYEIVGMTIDDAAGEAFDKSARLLGLGYPGGRAIQDAAVGGNVKRYSLPRGLNKDPFNFSFSGLKTAVLRTVEREGADLDSRDAAASIQEAIIDSLATKAMAAINEFQPAAMTLVGGVAANQPLRERLNEGCARRSLPFHVPHYDYCTDNAAMIAIAGSWRLAAGQRDGLAMDCAPNADLPSL